MPIKNYRTSTGFDPISNDLLIKMAEAPTKEHKDIESALNTLGFDAGAIGNIANENPNGKASKMYNEFSTALNSAASALASNGLSGKSRSDAMRLKMLFGTNISPIIKGEEARQKERDKYDVIIASDPSWIGRNPYKSSVDEYLDGAPGLGGISGDKVKLMAKEAGLAESAERIMKPKADGYGNIVTGIGYTNEEQQLIRLAMFGDDAQKSSASAELTKRGIDYNGVIASYEKIANSIDYENRGVDRKDVENQIIDGFFQGLTYTETSKVDRRADIALANANRRLTEIKIRDAEAKAAEDKAKMTALSDTHKTPIDVKGNKSGSATDKLVKEYFETHKKRHDGKPLDINNVKDREYVYSAIKMEYDRYQSIQKGWNAISALNIPEKEKVRLMVKYIDRYSKENHSNFSIQYRDDKSYIKDLKKYLRRAEDRFEDSGEIFSNHKTYNSAYASGNFDRQERKYVIGGSGEKQKKHTQALSVMCDMISRSGQANQEIRSVNGKKKKLCEIFKYSPKNEKGGVEMNTSISEISYTPTSLSNGFLLAYDPTINDYWQIPISTLPDDIVGVYENYFDRMHSYIKDNDKRYSGDGTVSGLASYSRENAGKEYRVNNDIETSEEYIFKRLADVFRNEIDQYDSHYVTNAEFGGLYGAEKEDDE